MPEWLIIGLLIVAKLGLIFLEMRRAAVELEKLVG